MKFEEILESFNDMFIMVLNQETKEMVYPDLSNQKGRNILYLFRSLEKKDNNTYFNPYTKEVYEYTEKEIIIDNKKYSLIRLFDITKYKNLVNEYVLDETTGLFLRKKLLKSLNDYLKQAVYNKESFSLTMLDIDFFKKVNDTYGHQFGDLALNDIARILNDKVNNNEKNEGILGRFGGEEFIFALKNTDYDYSLERNEYIREFIEYEMEYVDDKKIDLTCSFGSVYVDYDSIKDVNIDNMPDIRSRIDLIIKEADKNLYESKKNGRNTLTMTRFNK